MSLQAFQNRKDERIGYDNLYNASKQVANVEEWKSCSAETATMRYIPFQKCQRGGGIEQNDGVRVDKD